MFKPGMRGTEICRALDAHLREHPLLRDTGLAHHAGHGTGLRAHMDPDLNPDREGVLREGVRRYDELTKRACGGSDAPGTTDRCRTETDE